MSNICDDLRAAILQAAMQGKLTEQLPADGNTADYLQQVEKKKKKLIDKKIIKKRTTKSAATKNIDLETPPSWTVTALSNFCVDIFSGKSPKYSKTENNFRILGQKNNQEYGVDLTGLKYSTATFWETIDEWQFLQKNDVLLNTLGGGTVGRSGIFDLCDNNTYATDGHLFVFRTTNSYSAKYLLFFLRMMRNEIEKNAAGSTNQTFLKLSEVINWHIPTPPLAEQKRIVEKVDELMARVADLEQSADALVSLKKAFPDDIRASLLQYAMQGKLTKQLPEDGNAGDLLKKIKAEKEKLIAEGKIKKQKPLAPITDDEIPFNIPENWKWVRLGDLTALVSDGTHKTPKYVDNGVPFLSVQNISKGYFDFTKIKYITEKEHAELIKRIKPTIDDILFCRIGTLGKALKNTLDYEFSIFVSLGVVRLIDVRLVDYVIEVINSPVGFKWIQENKVGGGTHTYKINLSDLPNMLIPLPPLSEQKRISERLDALMQNINVVGDLIASE
ncbi:MAG: restriction endonuclease subunit S [Candidatus Saccharibacteria bacterium]|nr:restriction endonuclease subunit S [Candidatus Saccharibacteria bacterium]